MTDSPMRAVEGIPALTKGDRAASDIMTKSMARNVFMAGRSSFPAVFVLLTIHSHIYARTKAVDESKLTPSGRRGKHIWERNACIDCHTILGEGAYFAPELGTPRNAGPFRTIPRPPSRR